MVMATLLVARPEKCAELAQTLQALVAAARSQAGCQGGLAAQDLEGQPRFLVYLNWDSRSSLDRYTASEGFQVLLGAAGILLTEPARFRFFRFDAPGADPTGLRALLERGPAHPHGLVPDFRTAAPVPGELQLRLAAIGGRQPLSAELEAP